MFYGLALMIAAGCFTFGVVCILYLIKSLFGLNLMSGRSPLHPLYKFLYP